MACGVSYAQQLPFNVCRVTVHAADPSAEKIVEQILQLQITKPDTILVFTSTDPGLVAASGAASGVCSMANGEQRWIVYDPEVISAPAELEFALAHEVAHHVNQHLTNGDPHTKEQELEADEYAARYLTRLGWDKENLFDALDGLKLPLLATGGYPSRDERRAAVLAGFLKESDTISDRDKNDIQETLDRYASILISRHPKNLKGIWPTIEAPTINRYQSFIDTSKNLSLSVVANKWQHYATGILVTCKQTQSYERDGKKTEQAGAVSFLMVKINGVWVIGEMPPSSDPTM
jgi:hypothetical protein